MNEKEPSHPDNTAPKPERPATRIGIAQQIGAMAAGSKAVGAEFHHVDTVILDAGQAAAPPADGDPPYKGLDFYDVKDAPLFFGREKLTAELVQHVRDHAFLVIVGASGSGKSSLARAGLIASLLGVNPGPLEDGVLPPLGSRDWRYVAVTPTAHPFEALARGLAGDGAGGVALLKALAADPLALRDQAPTLAGAGGRLLLLVDQFEELFTLCKDVKKRANYIKMLLAACDEPDFGSAISPCTVILTVRADFYAQCISFENLRAALETHQKPIGAMNRAELQRTVELPARAGLWAFQQGLVEQILDDVGDQPGNLPLLSYALLETWDRRNGRVMTLAGYQAAGGVDKAISQTADRVLNELTRQGLGDQARHILLSLVEPGQEDRATRRREKLSDLMPGDGESPEAMALLALSARDARLVTMDGESVQISHEALITAWPKLGEWLTTYRDDLRLLDGIRDAAATWAAAKDAEKENLLTHRGGRLEDALKLRDAGEYSLADPAPAYLVASMALRDREREAERKRQRDRFRLIAGAAIVALALALLAGVFGIRAQNSANTAATSEAHAQEAQRQAQIERATSVSNAATAQAASTRAVEQQKTAEANAGEAKRQKAEAEEAARRAQAEGLVGHTRAELAKPIPDYSLALLLAQEAVNSTWKTDGYVLPNAERVLSDTIAAAPPWRMNLPSRRHSGPVNSVAFSPDGQHILTASEDGTARVWDAATGEELRRFSDTQAPISFAIYSPDGRQVATTGYGTCRIWEAATGREIRRLSNEDCGFDGSGSVPLAYSPDGKQIAAAGGKDTVHIWNAATGEEMRQLRGDIGWVWSVAYSPGSKAIVTVGDSDRAAHIWDVETGRDVRQLHNRAGGMMLAAYSPDGKTIISGSDGFDDGHARIWDTDTGQEVHHLSLDVYIYALSAAYSPNGKHILTVTDMEGVARIWDLDTPQEIHQLHGSGCYEYGNCGARSAAYSPDGQWVATGHVNGTIHIWDAATGKEVRQFGGHGCINSECEVSSAAYSPNGNRIVTVGSDRTARLWDAATGREILTLRGHDEGVWSASYSPDGRQIITTGCDQLAGISCTASSVRVWNAETAQEERQLISLNCDDSGACAVASAAHSPDGKQIVTVGSNQIARLWDAATGQEIHQLRGHTGIIRSAAYSPDSHQIVTASDDCTARIWDATTGKDIRRLAVSGCEGIDVPTPLPEGPSWPASERSISSAAFSPDGKQIVTANNDMTVRIWNAGTGQEVRPLRGQTGGVKLVAYSPDGRKIIMTVGHDGTARTWNAETGEQMHLLTGRRDRVSSAAYSPDGKSIVTVGCEESADGNSCRAVARIWDVTPKLDVHQFGDSNAGFSSAVYSPDGQFIMTTDGGTVSIWNAAAVTEQPILELPRHGCAEHNYCKVNAARYSPDGKQIVTAGGDRIAHIWDATTGKEIRQLLGHTAYVQSAAYSPDGKLIVTASGDKTARIWDASSGQEVHRLIGHTDTVMSAAFSPNGKTIVTASQDKTARIWDVATGQLVHQLNGHQLWVRSAAYSPDGRFVVTASSDGTVRIWDAATGREVRQIVSDLCKKNSVWCSIYTAIYSPDSRYIVIAEGSIPKNNGTEDSTIRFFDAATGKEVRSLKGHRGSVGFIAFSPDGKRIVTAGEYDVVRIWDANIEDLLEKAQRLISRDPPLLTPDELGAYGLVEEVR